MIVFDTANDTKFLLVNNYLLIILIISTIKNETIFKLKILYYKKSALKYLHIILATAYLFYTHNKL